jgi:AcrR family transcriptional regulator
LLFDKLFFLKCVQLENVMKTWPPTDPKASLMEQKRAAIVAAARESFLVKGYSDASIDGIALSAGVSVKTIYGHFENKAELFRAVIAATCTDPGFFTQMPDDAELAIKFRWFTDVSLRGLQAAGEHYLRHLLSKEQLALYRVITRDGARFPELGRLYHENISQGRTAILVAYLTRMARTRDWRQKDLRQSAEIYEALLRADIFEKVLHGAGSANAATIAKQAGRAARVFWRLVEES